MQKQKNQLCDLNLLLWISTRIKRVVRSTSAAEACSMGETMELCSWVRGLADEMLNYSGAPPPSASVLTVPTSRLPVSLVTDARSLYDVLTQDAANVSDKRLSLEAALLRHAIAHENIRMHWVRSEQMLADGLTKDSVDTQYLMTVLLDVAWMLGPDHRAPRARKGRALVPPSDDQPPS